MAVRYVKDFEFPSAAGYSQSTPSKVTGQMLAKGGPAKAPKGPGIMVMIGIPKKPMKKADGGNVDSAMLSQMSGDASALSDAERTMASQYPGAMTDRERRMMQAAQIAKRRAAMSPAQRSNNVPPSANWDQDQMNRAERGYKKGGKVAKVMHEFGKGELHSGSKKGPKVTNPKQAVAIALSEQRASKKAKGGLQSEDGSPLKSVPVKDIKSGKVPQSTDEDYYGKAKTPPMPPRRPMGLKKGGMAHEDVAEDKSLIKSMVKPGALKKANGGMVPPPLGGTPLPPNRMGQQYTPGQGSALQSLASNNRQNVSPDQLDTLASQQRLAAAQAARSKGIPVAPRAPMIPQQAAAPGGQRIGVNAPRPGQPNVGAIRAAMARRASQAMPENAPSMMKKGGKVNC